ncbi:hypothetical protein IGI39_003333 [Enterococcus sp. AZ135]|uniref:hypothetical protein n=2 Tax=Enterococcus TaxID=1350 RepID=UPI003F26055D
MDVCGASRESVGVSMKLTKYVVGTVFNDRIIEKRYLRTKERALKLVPDNQRDNYYTKYLGEEEIDLYCECCDKELSAGDTYIKEDEHTRYCEDCYEEDTITFYTVGGEPVGNDNEIVSYDSMWLEH